jgi:hypothetical protein
VFKNRLQRLECLVRQSARADAKPLKPLRNHHDLIELLEEQIQALRSEPWVTTLAKASAIARLLRIAHQVMTGEVMASRIEALERILKTRRCDAQEVSR